MTKRTTDYTKLSKELDELLADLQAGGSDIDSSIKQYERGMQIIEELKTYLAQAKIKLQKLNQPFQASSYLRHSLA